MNSVTERFGPLSTARGSIAMTTTSDRHPSLRVFWLTAIGLAALLMTMGAAPAMAIPPGPPVRVDISRVSFAGTTVDTAAGENVDLAGQLDLLTLVSGSDSTGWTVRWLANPDRAVGTGEVSGARYVLRAVDGGTVSLPPGPPVRTAFFDPTFALSPSGPAIHPPSPCRVLLALSFDAAGRVTGVQAHVGESPPVWGTTD